MEAAPRMKAHIRFSVFFPSRDGKQNGWYSRRYFKVGEQVKFFRIGWLKILTLAQADLMEKFDPALWCGLVDFVTVYSKDDVRFTFRDCTEINA